MHKVQEFKKPDPVTVTGVPPSKDPKFGKIDITWEEAPACCMWTDGKAAPKKMQREKITFGFARSIFRLGL